ncbi:DEAD/DEAH box helicase (plasmid) [Azospirillum sp. A29]|uniref:DEAD/DEAH box helicase n=1 Tax=Azospirillum sp. A29 TaxID=3160606 RepID=UPI0036729080
MTARNRSLLWTAVAEALRTRSRNPSLRRSQRRSLEFIAERLPHHGVLVADEVGLGKTRIACEVMAAVMECGGRTAVVVPPGLIYQWEAEFERFITMNPRRDVRHLRRFEDLFGGSFPILTRNRLALISHQFRVPVIRANSPTRHRLPWMVRWCLGERWFGATGWQAGCADREEEWAAAEHLARWLSQDVEDMLRDLPDLRPWHEEHRRLPEKIRGEAGRPLLGKLMGSLIGPVDLLVIDEAHKSRDDAKQPYKLLGRLLQDILVRSKASRSLALTATPVELNVDQWHDLLERVGFPRHHTASAGIGEAIAGFGKALRQASEAPDVPERLERLETASARFTEALRGIVCRRRRIREPDMLALLKKMRDARLDATGAHPHRQYSVEPILLESLTEEWRHAAVALEAAGAASRGAGDGTSSRRIDSRYPSGLPCFDVEVDAPPKPPAQADADAAKSYRAQYWRHVAQQAVTTPAHAGDNPLWRHPRVRAALARIEHWLGTECAGTPEKVLVFGRFTAPMKALQTMVNARHVVRCLDRGQPVLVHHDLRLGALLAAYAELRREDETKKEEEKKTLTGTLAGRELSDEALLDMADVAHKTYGDLRDSLARTVQEEFLSTLPGASLVKQLNRKQVGLVLRQLRTDVLDHLLTASRVPKSTRAPIIRDVAREVWIGYLRGSLDPHAPRQEAEEAAARRKDDDDGDLNRSAGTLCPDTFVDLVVGGEEAGQHSQLCRLMDGEMAQSRRRMVQTAFNRTYSYPRVLIAQSMVGREGLNLHEACRVVLLFHPEWNPAVMEQQIGRVDRIGSRWERLADVWKRGKLAKFPYLHVESLVFQGTYDQYQHDRLEQRRKAMNAQLFGALLDERVLDRVPSRWRQRLADAAPDFTKH